MFLFYVPIYDIKLISFYQDYFKDLINLLFDNLKKMGVPNLSVTPMEATDGTPNQI